MRKHGVSLYRSDVACRCDICTAGNTMYARTERAQRYARRVVMDGALVAPEVDTHGTRDAYNNWGCRCGSCTKANAEASQAKRDASKARRAAEVST